MMPRIYFRLVSVTFAIIVAVLVVIHTQPYDDHGLGELLSQAGCSMPCFMGFKPGVMTRHEVIDLLKTSDQFESLSSYWDDYDSSAPILLIWNRTQPCLMCGVVELNITFQNVDPRKIARISVGLGEAITLSDFYLVLGQPSRYLASINSANIGSHHYRVRTIYLYDQYNLSFFIATDCPTHLTRLLQQPIKQIEYDAQMRTDGTNPMRSFRIKTVCL